MSHFNQIELAQFKVETEVVAKLMRESKEHSDNVSLSIEDVPAEIGNYGLFDGLRCRGAGTTRNMHRSMEELVRLQQPLRPIYCWKPDTDGSAALWLDGKVRCSLCKVETILDTFSAEDHYEDVHGIKKTLRV